LNFGTLDFEPLTLYFGRWTSDFVILDFRHLNF
jgi:hypothetical protein